eukprot:6214763-Pleurochrysis_carterae.AAC.5
MAARRQCRARPGSVIIAFHQVGRQRISKDAVAGMWFNMVQRGVPVHASVTMAVSSIRARRILIFAASSCMSEAWTGLGAACWRGGWRECCTVRTESTEEGGGEQSAGGGGGGVRSCDESTRQGDMVVTLAYDVREAQHVSLSRPKRSAEPPLDATDSQYEFGATQLHALVSVRPACGVNGT